MNLDKERIILAHGGGGRLSHQLIEGIFIKHFSDPTLANLEDAALLDADRQNGGIWAFSTDSFVVQPLFFPGGDIGKLAVCGTVNDISMRGAIPVALSAAFILEEGFPLADLDRIVASMAVTADAAGARIVAGDTKVVEQGHGDGCFITTAGIGWVPQTCSIGTSQLRPGDVILVNGSVGDHGMAIMTRREGLEFESPITSDCAPLNGLVQTLLEAVGDAAHTLRDATRGGIATVLNEWAMQSRLGIEVRQTTIPVKESVQAACELLGLDPLYVANEGKLVAAVAPEAAAPALSALQTHPLGREAAIIGTVTETHPGRVLLQTPFSATRVLDMLSGEQLPRIC